jgi:hypothetical protein
MLRPSTQAALGTVLGPTLGNTGRFAGDCTQGTPLGLVLGPALSDALIQLGDMLILGDALGKEVDEPSFTGSGTR